jgi:hypothetical protein
VTPPTIVDWAEANQRYLTAALAEVRRELERHAGTGEPVSAEPKSPESGEKAAEMPAPPALEILCGLFGLSPFERSTLLLCAGVELDAAFPALCAAAQGDAGRPHATFGLALTALPDPHWSALSPAAPLRRWRLVEVGGESLTRSPLRTDERVLHHLAGVQYLDEQLEGFVETVQDADELLPSQRALAGRLAGTWSRSAGGPLPVAQVSGGDREGRRTVAVAACEKLGLALCKISAQNLPSDLRELGALARLWEREAALSSSALLLECGDNGANEEAHERAALRFIESVGGTVIVAGVDHLPAPRRSFFTLRMPDPTPHEKRDLWLGALGESAESANGQVDSLVAQFDLGAGAIRSACAEALGRHNDASEDLGDLLWKAGREQARPRLEDLAGRIEPAAAWDDLVLPEAHKQLLREVAVHVRRRTTVYESWGFGARSSRGLGISALFAGPSGTGKTMAAEVLADELRLDLYRIDLSSVVSKYIGETEKNLRRVFDAAEAGGAILLFDEADALFGKRSEVKDSHDRYANIEVSYLLQRMEAYRGLAILTTNMKGALDVAFLRRIRFVVQFPFPDAANRAEIWRRVFPAETPTKGLDFDKLARLNVAGGNIRNIALNAAFLAADAEQPVRMKHLLRAARGEYAKLEKPLTGAEIGGWK